MELRRIALVCCFFVTSLALTPEQKLQRNKLLKAFPGPNVRAYPKCPYHPQPVNISQSLPESLKKAFMGVSEILEKTVNKTSVPGIMANVVYNNEVLYSEGFGTVSKQTTKKPNGDSIFRIGSVSKVFADLMVYMLLDQGYISSLDDPFTKYCPSFSIHTIYESQDITLRQMMSQLSGLPREAPCTPGNATIYCNFTTAVIVERLAKQYLIYPPWTTPSYSNLAFALLGHCLQESFFPSSTYEEFVQKNILTPLGMKNTGFRITESVKSRMAVGYLPDGSEAPLTDLGWLGPAGQMYSTVNDLAKISQFFYNAVGHEAVGSGDNAALLSRDLLREMLLPLYINPDLTTGFGTPWEILFTNNYTVITKGGNVGGYSALFSMVPDLHLGVNILYSGSAEEDSSAVDVMNILIPAFVEALRPLQPTFPIPPDPSSYLGTYRADSIGIQFSIEMEQGQMLLVTETSAAYLSYQRPLLLQIDYDPSAINCLMGQLLANRHEWLMFDQSSATGEIDGFSLPGLLYGIKFLRQDLH